MNQKIETYGGYFEAFMETLNEKERDKIEYGLMLLETQHKVSANKIREEYYGSKRTSK